MFLSLPRTSVRFVVTNIHSVQVLCQPGSLKAFKRFNCTTYIMTQKEGGRHTSFSSTYSPQVFFLVPACCIVVAIYIFFFLFH